MKNISELKNCFGCGVCVKACPVKIISLEENHDGFYQPIIHEPDKCISCGLCLKVCSFCNDNEFPTEADVDAYAAWSNDEKVRQWCSSGGVGFEIGRQLINEGYDAVGVRYDVNKVRAEHFIAASVEDFMPSVGSKYIPSSTVDAFTKIDLKSKYLITGTPCQIASFRRLIRHFRVEDNFILLDFFCHGVPSLKLWDAYISEVVKKIGPIKFVSWRNKSTGLRDSWNVNTDLSETPSESIDWHESYNLAINGEKNFLSSRLSQGDLFFEFFLGNVCLNECCYNCPFKMIKSGADIRIGDLWGKSYDSDTKGVSALLALTERGKQIVSEINGTCTLEMHPLEIVTEGQMGHSPNKPWVRRSILNSLVKNNKIPVGLMKIWRFSKLPQRIFSKIKRILYK
ncbi:MAG: Coenzyme F420 hydrogenase/dehydrogenase, beta subunit C-terminal domain [Muribaculaceae bacterium]|nr:Coenzyme F420 hydrogenase/dehydrogenase, beta subunit C-terminal domain [Muribaculaceae bacterium]